MMKTRNRRKNHELPVLWKGEYGTPAEAERIRQKKSRDWWEISFILMGIIIFTTFVDAGVLYNVLDVALEENSKILWLTVAGGTFVLNFLAVLGARVAHAAIYHTSRFAKWGVFMVVMGFMVVFVSSLYLRIAYMDAYASAGGHEQLINQAAASINTDPQFTANKKTLSTAVYLIVIPLGTSVVNFLLSFLCFNPVKRRANGLRIRRRELQAEIIDLKVAQEGLRSDKQMLLDMDEEHYQAAQELAVAKSRDMKARARFLLAEYLKDAKSITHLSEEAAGVVEPDQSIGILSVHPYKSRESAQRMFPAEALREGN